MRRPIFILFLIALLGTITATIVVRQSSAPKTFGLAVAVSFDSLGEFARQVGGNDVTVTTITPPGAEPHDYEPSPQDLLRVERSAVFLFQGSGFDAWSERIRPSLKAHGVAVLNMTEALAQTHTLLSPAEGAEPGEASNAAADPHTWLDPKLAEATVVLTRDTLIARDPQHAVGYTKRAQSYLDDLRSLDAEYMSRLASCTHREFVTTHAAFQYLAHDYHLTMIPIAGVSPDTEPSPRHLAELAQLVKEKKIRTIFFETLVSPKVAETLAQETGTNTDVLNPLEGLTTAERAAGKTYLSVMRDNLKNLTLALECT